jgi:multicomponent Na+:H+ antiporter subunit F
MIELATTTALGALTITGALCVLALVRRRSLADRIVALDLLLVTIVSGIAVGSVRTGEGTYLDVLVVASLLGFVGTVTVARFIERRGA